MCYRSATIVCGVTGYGILQLKFRELDRHIKGKVTLSQKIVTFGKIDTKVAKMLFLSVSHESIGILTISRKKFSAQLLLVAEIGSF